MAAVISPIAGTRVEPKDGYVFMRGTVATFKIIFVNDGRPIVVDALTFPMAHILKPLFLSNSQPLPDEIISLAGSLVPGQEYEYQFQWFIPIDMVPLADYVISYSGRLGGLSCNYGDEYFSIISTPGMVGLQTPSYANTSDVRMMKFNIDSYLPPATKDDVIARNNIIEYHLRQATIKLRTEVSLNKQRGFNEDYKLFCTYYAIYSILLASRGEDGSSVSDANLQFWKNMWERVLAKELRASYPQGIPLGRG